MNAFTPLITIGITCFNAKDTIERAIKTAQQQDWTNREIIIVDDCSTDGSHEILEELACLDKNFSVIRHDRNLGYPSALNTIVEHAKGEYIAFFDDDDESEPQRLSKQYQRLHEFEQSNKGIEAVCYSHRRVFVDGKEDSKGFVTAIGAKAPEPRGNIVANFLLWHQKDEQYSWGEFGSCTMMASRKLLSKFLFDPEFKRCAEWDFAIRLALEGGCVISVDEPLVIQHKTQTIDKSGRRPLTFALMLRKKHKGYLKQKHRYWASVFMAYSRFYYFRDKVWKSRFCIACARFLLLRQKLFRLISS